MKRRMIAAALMSAALVLALAGCYRWAHKDCRGHGGLDHVSYLHPANVWIAHCKDGTRIAK